MERVSVLLATPTQRDYLGGLFKKVGMDDFIQTVDDEGNRLLGIDRPVCGVELLPAASLADVLAEVVDMVAVD